MVVEEAVDPVLPLISKFPKEIAVTAPEQYQNQDLPDTPNLDDETPFEVDSRLQSAPQGPPVPTEQASEVYSHSHQYSFGLNEQIEPDFYQYQNNPQEHPPPTTISKKLPRSKSPAIPASSIHQKVALRTHGRKFHPK